MSQIPMRRSSSYWYAGLIFYLLIQISLIFSLLSKTSQWPFDSAQWPGPLTFDQATHGGGLKKLCPVPGDK